MPQTKKKNSNGTQNAAIASRPSRRRSIHTHAFACALGCVATFGVLVLTGMLDVTPPPSREPITDAANRGDSRNASRNPAQRRAAKQEQGKDSRQTRRQPDPVEELRRINAINERNRRLMESRHRPPQPPHGPQPHTPYPHQPGQPPQR